MINSVEGKAPTVMLVLVCFFLICPPLNAQRLELTIARLPDGSHEYYVELLRSSLQVVGYETSIIMLPPASRKRILSMLEYDMISLHWFMKSKRWDRLYTPVNVGTTNGLISSRVLLIPENSQDEYTHVETLDDFRAQGRIGAFQSDWFAADVWRANNLNYRIQDIDRRMMLDMMAGGGRGIDYCTVGFNEVNGEGESYPGLALEKRLLFMTERDVQFYLGKSAAVYRPVLENALTQAKDSGLMDKLMRKHWETTFTTLDVDSRTRMYLKLSRQR